MKDNIKVLGKPLIYEITDENSAKYYFPKYKTEIFINRDDPYFIGKLEELGFKIIDMKKNKLKVYLPFHWLHLIDDKKEETVVDRRGRMRLKINRKEKTTQLIRRFDFGINLITSNNDGYQNLNSLDCFITDSGGVVASVPFPKNFIKDFEKSKMDIDELLELCKQSCASLLDTTVPGWLDEVNYWDADIDFSSIK